MSDIWSLISVLLLILFPLLVFAFVIGAIVFWVLMLIDAIKRKFKRDNDRVIWVLVIVLAGLIGAIIYYFVVKKV